MPRVKLPIRNPPLLIRSCGKHPLSSADGDMLVPLPSVIASDVDG